MKQINNSRDLNKKIFLSLLLSLAIFGCQQPNETVKTSPKKELTETAKQSISNPPIAISKEQLRLEKIKPTPQKFSHLINGQKYLATAVTIKKGDKLYDLAIKQYGLVKGSIVVILDENTTNKALLSLGKTEKIADNTYRIHFRAQQDLLKQYQQIKTMQGIKRIELELDFTPIKKQIFI